MGKYDDLKGRWARLTRDVTTKGGDRFPKGSRVRITGADRSGLWFRMVNPDPKNLFGPKYMSCHGCPLWYFDFEPHKLNAPQAPKRQRGEWYEGDE